MSCSTYVPTFRLWFPSSWCPTGRVFSQDLCVSTYVVSTYVASNLMVRFANAPDLQRRGSFTFPVMFSLRMFRHYKRNSMYSEASSLLLQGVLGATDDNLELTELTTQVEPRRWTGLDGGFRLALDRLIDRDRSVSSGLVTSFSHFCPFVSP